MIRLADQIVPARQALGAGRVADAVTGAALADYEIALGYRIGSESGVLPVELGRRDNGWFVLHLAATGLPADLASAPEVELTARVTAPGRQPTDVGHTVAGSHFALTIRGSTAPSAMTVATLTGTVLDFTARLDPPAVALRGIVLREHDPHRPVAAATVSAAPLPAVTTDAAGRFFIPALPLLPVVEIDAGDGTSNANRSLRIDYSNPVNTVTLSLPDPTVESDHA